MVPSGLTSSSSFDRHQLTEVARKYYIKKWSPPVWAIISDWLLIAIIVYVSWIFISPLLWPVSMLIVASRQHALLVLMHDAAHFSLVPDRRWNDILSDIFLAFPHFITTESYRNSHFLHHRWLGTEKDPDLYRKLNQFGSERFWRFPKPMRSIIGNLILDLFGWGLFAKIQRIFYFHKRKEPSGNSKNLRDIFLENRTRILYYLIFLMIAIITKVWLIIFLFWVIPIFTFLPALLRVRSYAEHFNVIGKNELNSTRNIYAGLIESFLFGPHNVGHHITHHLYPQIPFFALPKMSEHLEMEPGFRQSRLLARGYFIGGQGSVIWKLSEILQPSTIFQRE